MEKPSFDPFEQPPLVQALLVALHTLVVHNSMEVTSEGETWTLDFMPEIARIKEALQSADYDTTQPMLAPIGPDELGRAENEDDADESESVGPDAGHSG